MTNEEAIELIKVAQAEVEWNCPMDYAAAFDMAIKALEQKPCEDAISRREAIKKFTYNHKGERIPDHDCDNFPTQISIKTVKEILRELPSVTPQPKTGHWTTKDGKEQGYDIGGVKTWYIQIMCSECGFIKTAIEGLTGQYHYCPNCGAKMVESKAESEG